MNEGEIKQKLWNLFSNYDYRLFNVFVFQNESDFLAVSKSGYVWEIEIKVSRADFKNDFKKMDRGGKNKHEKLQSGKGLKPNKFCFAVPNKLISVKEVPDYAGLIYFYKGGSGKIIKRPKFLHKDNLFNNNYFLKQMLNKFYFRHTNLRIALDYKEWELKYKQGRLPFYS